MALAQAVLLVGSGLLGGAAWAAPTFTTQFPLEQCTFVAKGRNLHFSLQPGHRLLLAGGENGDTVVVEITVLHETRSITFAHKGVALTIETRVVDNVVELVEFDPAPEDDQD